MDSDEYKRCRKLGLRIRAVGSLKSIPGTGARGHSIQVVSNHRPHTNIRAHEYTHTHTRRASISLGEICASFLIAHFGNT